MICLLWMRTKKLKTKKFFENSRGFSYWTICVPPTPRRDLCKNSWKPREKKWKISTWKNANRAHIRRFRPLDGIRIKWKHRFWIWLIQLLLVWPLTPECGAFKVNFLLSRIVHLLLNAIRFRKNAFRDKMLFILIKLPLQKKLPSWTEKISRWNTWHQSAFKVKFLPLWIEYPLLRSIHTLAFTDKIA